jgi:hypothetical protein
MYFKTINLINNTQVDIQVGWDDNNNKKATKAGPSLHHIL